MLFWQDTKFNYRNVRNYHKLLSHVLRAYESERIWTPEVEYLRLLRSPVTQSLPGRAPGGPCGQQAWIPVCWRFGGRVRMLSWHFKLRLFIQRLLQWSNQGTVCIWKNIFDPPPPPLKLKFLGELSIKYIVCFMLHTKEQHPYLKINLSIFF